MNLTEQQLKMMKHAWGYNGERPGYRSRYCTDTTNADMLELVRLGMFLGPYAEDLVGPGCGMYYLTDKAKEMMMELKLADGGGDFYQLIATEFDVDRQHVKSALYLLMYEKQLPGLDVSIIQQARALMKLLHKKSGDKKDGTENQKQHRQV